MWRRKALAQAVVIEQLTQELERMRWKLSDAHLKAVEDYKRVDFLERVRKSLEAQIALLQSSTEGREGTK